MSQPSDGGEVVTAAAAPSPGEQRGLSSYLVLVAAGAFATTFAQQKIIGHIPTQALLKDGFHLEKEDVAVFFFWATFAWNLKPIAGILTDAFPLFGTRRRHYMMFGAGIAAAAWLVMGQCSHNYGALLATSIVVNVATVFASTVMGGLMVEAGQKFGAPGRIASLRQVVQSISIVIGPLLGGFLAGKAYENAVLGLAPSSPALSALLTGKAWVITTGIAATTMALLVVLSFFVLKEKSVDPRVPVASDVPDAKYRPSGRVIAGIVALSIVAAALAYRTDLRNIGISLFALDGVFLMILGLAVVPTVNPVIVRAQTQLSQIFESRTLWLAVFMLFLVYTVPGLNTALYFRQTDDLHFSTDFIGQMGSIEGAVGIVAALFYGTFCRKFSLRFLIIGGVGLSAVATFLYLIYAQDTAPFVHAASGSCGVLAELALMDLAVRSTPRGCEALGFALMMSVRNFGLSMSDVIGSQIMDTFHVSFPTMVTVNGATTLAVLLFVPLLPLSVVSRKEGEAIGA